MSIDTFIPKNNFYLNPLFDSKYLHYKTSGPEYDQSIVEACRRTHAEGYLNAGLATKAGIRGAYLIPEIDKSSTILYDHNVSLYLAKHPTDEQQSATARILHDTTPTVNLFPESQRVDIYSILNELRKSNYDVHELSALSKSRSCGPLAVAEIIRELLRDTAGKNIVLYCSLVSPVRQMLVQSLSEFNLMPISSSFTLPETEYRKMTELVPVIIYPDQLLSNMIKSLENEKDNATYLHRVRLILFYCHGLGREFVPTEVANGVLQRSIGVE